MAVAIGFLQVTDELLHVVHVVIQVELTLRQGHQAGVFPVGDVDLVVFEHGLDGVAQERGVVARQRSHHQHHRLALELVQRGQIVRKTLEAAQLTKRLVDFHPLVNRHLDTVHVHRAQTKFRLFVVLAQTVHQVKAGRNALRHGQLAQRRQWIAV